MSKNKMALIQKRRDEIIESARKLYQTMPYCKITFRDVAEHLSVGRSSIYNYFQTMEEIFLGILQKEYENWNKDILALLDKYPTLDIDGYANALANTLEDREIMLKLLAMNIYELENNSRHENLVQFKVAFGQTITSIITTLKHYFPSMSDDDRVQFIYILFPYLMGVYCYTHIEPYQENAMIEANVPHHCFTPKELVETLIKRALSMVQTTK